MLRESLLPDTEALSRETVEFHKRGRGFLVRYRNRDGAVYRQVTTDADEAGALFWEWVARIRAELNEVG